ncbi:DMT family transporter [filamentous cyanobacterium LEGE 11480]|uniref:DMT family transporter n=1 Tax=Romeriopsis navalis LEGE 11480 TaxID=2777977 RepID=A0A928Z513_9CYAN|nr:DMT family transporter [Romeriopsis navalis]MBE9030978.1 DMT family transporter [Romeriopsis navalis LEGE 11480]
MGLSAFPGELAALATALFWAMSSVIYTHLGQKAPPLTLNLLKGLMAIGMLLLTIWLVNDPWPQVSVSTYFWLLLSGAVGIGFGDTVYFAALNQLGARQTLLLLVAAPPIAAIGSWLFLQEQLPLLAWVGISVTIVGIAWVISERTQAREQAKALSWLGIGLALLAAGSEAAGAILSRFALSQTTIDPLWSAVLRLVGGTVVVQCLLIYRRARVLPRSAVQTQKLLQAVLLASFFSTYLGIWCQQIALKYTTPGIAQTLGATSPLFVLPIVLWQGERVSRKAILGVLVALVGIGILFMYGGI